MREGSLLTNLRIFGIYLNKYDFSILSYLSFKCKINNLFFIIIGNQPHVSLTFDKNKQYRAVRCTRSVPNEDEGGLAVDKLKNFQYIPKQLQFVKKLFFLIYYLHYCEVPTLIILNKKI